MDSCRYDIFVEANAPHLHDFTDYRQVYSRAGCTVPSVFSLFMNLSWYEAKKDKLIPWLKSWAWVPTDLSEMGFQTAFITPNKMFELYKPLFKHHFNTYDIPSSPHSAKEMIDKTIEFFKQDKRKFVFLLFMETHFPYVHPRKMKRGYRYPIKHQKDSVEILDKEFGRLVKSLEGSNTNIVVFSDHGDLDYSREGDHGHGPGKFHRKLFEIPLGRKTI